MVKFSGLDLFWGTVEPDADGTFTVYYQIDIAGAYDIHLFYRLTDETWVAIAGSPFQAVITTVPCPIVGEPVPCNGQGTCLDTGDCKCDGGWDGEYCQVDLAKWLRMAIVVENSVVGAFIIMFIFNVVWQKCVRDQQMFERLQHDDTESDW